LYALITGASSGIGKEIAYRLAESKIDLLLVSRRKPELDSLKAELESRFGIHAQVISADLSREDECRRMFEESRKYAPEIIVNNAGFGIIGEFADIALEDELRMIRLNVEGLHILTKLFVQSMDRGVVLNVASMAGFLPTPRLAAYAATKAYVYSLSRAIDYELRKAKKSIRILALCPGPVDTNFSRVAGGHSAVRGMTAERCSRIAVRGIFRNRVAILPGFGNKIARFLLRFLPLSWVFPLSYAFQKKKKD